MLGFRNLQELFRVYWYRAHLEYPLLIDIHGKVNAIDAMSQILEKIDDDV